MNKVYIGIIIVLSLIILFLRECGAKCPDITTAPVKSDTTFVMIHDMIKQTVLVPITKIVEHRPVPVTGDDTTFLSQINKIDTGEVVSDYFTTRSYSDTGKVGDFGTFVINDDITQNKIKNRQIIYNLKFPDVTKTVAIKQRNQVWLGIGLGGTKDFIGAGPQVTIKTAGNKMYHIGAMFTTQNNFYYTIGTSFLIHL